MAWKNYYKSHSTNYTIPIEKLEGLLWEKSSEVKMMNENGEQEWWMVNGEWESFTIIQGVIMFA